MRRSETKGLRCNVLLYNIFLLYYNGHVCVGYSQIFFLSSYFFIQLFLHNILLKPRPFCVLMWNLMYRPITYWNIAHYIFNMKWHNWFKKYLRITMKLCTKNKTTLPLFLEKCDIIINVIYYDAFITSISYTTSSLFIILLSDMFG